MASEDVDIRIGGDSAEAESAIKRMVDVLKRLGVAVGNASQSFRGMSRRSDRAVKDLDNTGKSAKKTTNNLEALKRGAQAAGGRVGEMAGRVEALGQGLGALGGPAGAALLATAALAATAVAAAATAAAMVKLTRAGRDAVEALEPFSDTGLGIPPEQVERIEAANDALDAVVLTGQRLAAEIAANIGPSVEYMATVLVALGIAATEAFESFADGTSIVTRGFDAIGRAFKPFVDAQAGYLRAIRAVRQATAELFSDDASLAETPGLDERIASLDRLSMQLSGGVTPAAIQATESLLDMDEARSIFDGVTSVMRGLRVETQATDAAAMDVKQSLIDLAMKQAEAERQRIAAIEAAAETQRAAADAEKDSLIALAAKRAEVAAQEQAERNARINGFQNQLSAGASLAGTLSDIFARAAQNRADSDEKSAERSKKAALTLFRLQQAASISQIVISSIQNAIQLAAPPPQGLGPILGPIFAATQGAAAIAQVSSQQPPKFHIGGVVSGGPTPPGGRPTERMAIVEDGERILTRDQQRRGGEPITVIAQLSMGRRFAEEVVLTSRNSGGAMARVSEPRGRGQRRYRR